MLSLSPLCSLLAVDIGLAARGDGGLFNASNNFIKIVVIVIVDILCGIAVFNVHLGTQHFRHISRVQVQRWSPSPLGRALATDHGQVFIRFHLLHIVCRVQAYALVDTRHPLFHEVAGQILVHKRRRLSVLQLPLILFFHECIEASHHIVVVTF